MKIYIENKLAKRKKIYTVAMRGISPEDYTI
jgi:hypothetical protein